MKVLEHRIPPPILVVLTGLVMWGLSLLSPRIPLGDNIRLASVGVIVGLATVFLWAGVLAFRKARTTIDPVNLDRTSSLVVSGIYRVSRNPMYVGFTGVLLGWGIYLASAAALLGPVVFALFVTRFQIIPEERILRQRFGVGYERYVCTTPRWL